ncbi:MAG: peptidoglycan DD-metalloendopeptidase family protein [Bacteroidetes bacterium]|nr:peptidoglycan DD-metalloendopeptidase family protein [Bacteroidota bacterium]
MQAKNRNYLFLLLIAAVIFTLLVLIRHQEPAVSEETPPASDTLKIQTSLIDSDTNIVKSEELTVESLDTTLPESSIEDFPEVAEEITWNFGFRKKNYFRSPINQEILLSGTFGELRANHFHSGLDVRTGGVEGAEVFAAADGYVARVRVMERGYGKVLYIQHGNGTMTVYGHLQKFDGEIQDQVLKQQYKRESYEFEWYPSPGSLRVKKGQRIAFSGNTGGSGGPHLHFEVRDGKNSDAYNPLLYGISVRDVLPPEIKNLQIYRIDESVRSKTGTFPWLPVLQSGAIEVGPGTYGIGAYMVDYFTDKLNKLGVNYVVVTANGRIIHRQNIEHYAFDDGRMTNQYINFYYFMNHGVPYAKLFKDKGNTLPIFEKEGKITVRDGDSVRIVIKARDMAGHEDKAELSLICHKNAPDRFQSVGEYGGKLCRSNQVNTLVSEHARVTIPANSMYNDFYLTIKEQEGKEDLASPLVRVHDVTVPLHHRINVSIEPRDQYKSLISKLVLMEYDAQSRNSSSRDAAVTGGRVAGDVKNFGIYYLALDTIPPKLDLHAAGRTLVARVTDAKSDIKYYRGTLDGKWILFEYEYKRNQLKAVIPDDFKPGTYTLKLVVRDQVGNETAKTMQVSI